MLALLDVLSRLGPVDEAIKARLAAADVDTLRRWFGRALGATTHDEVFRDD